MRNLPVIRERWSSGGPYIGDRKPVTRLTVQERWEDTVNDVFLRKTSSAGVGSSVSRGVPVRWFQNQANSQVEREIPNINTISVDRSIDQDAASIRFDLNNNWLYTHGGATQQSVLGRPGYFTPDHGNSPEAEARWGHEANEWNGILVPNALIRVYTGYGGETGTIASQVAAGNLALFGIFLIDDVSVSTDGKITLTGRDMMKLLIEQQLFPPLVPSNKYPLSYYRWKLTNVGIRAAAKMITSGATAGPTPGDKATGYYTSAVDKWYGHNYNLHGHRGTDSIDGSAHSYALSVGNSGPDKPFATNWWEYTCGEAMNAVYVHPWAGGYTMYVSVLEGGVWQGTDTVPYDPSHLFATQSPAVDTGANIPYVAKFTVPHEVARDYVLPRTYSAERVRVSFRHLVDSGIGVWRYRSGIREFKNRGIDIDPGTFGSQSTVGTATKIDPWVAAAGFRYHPTKSYSQGYVTASCFNQQDAFGDAARLPRTNVPFAFGNHMDTPMSLAFTKDAKGYYTVTAGGEVIAHGDAVHYGDPYTEYGFTAGDGYIGEFGYIWDITVTHTGLGYWCLSTGGGIYSFGDAPNFGDMIYKIYHGNHIVSVTAHPTDYGFWVVRNDGKVFAVGAAAYHGSPPTTGPDALRFKSNPETDDTSAGLDLLPNASERAHCIRSTSTGNGYWILTSKGRVFAFGDAKHHGQPAQLEDHAKNLFTEAYWKILPAPNDTGYLLLHASGRITPHGDVEYFGGPVPGTQATLRRNGNYLDYTDIIKDLVRWSGFLFYDPDHPTNEPAPIYGALESTGAFAKERLPDEIFDKKPVVDAITTLREIVGYYAWVDSQGRFRFESPNTWHVGNFDEDGNHIKFLHEIDEKKNATQYATSHSDEALRSKIIISSHDPYADLSDTITTRYTPPSAAQLRGMVKPAMWINDHFMNPDEQQVMAELIGLQITFQERLGQLSCLANPEIEIGDQIRIYERQTEEVYVHYVRGISFNHDLNAGTYDMTLTTHWLSSGREDSLIIGGAFFPASPELAARMEDQQYGKTSRDPGMRL